MPDALATSTAAATVKICSSSSLSISVTTCWIVFTISHLQARLWIMTSEPVTPLLSWPLRPYLSLVWGPTRRATHCATSTTIRLSFPSWASGLARHDPQTSLEVRDGEHDPTRCHRDRQRRRRADLDGRG